LRRILFHNKHALYGEAKQSLFFSVVRRGQRNASSNQDGKGPESHSSHKKRSQVVYDIAYSLCMDRLCAYST
jgi:hypothetical protein